MTYRKYKNRNNTLGPSGLEIMESARRPLPYVEVPPFRTKPVSGDRVPAPERNQRAKSASDAKRARKDLVISIVREIFSLPHPVHFTDLLKLSPVAKQAASEMLRQNRIRATRDGLVTNLQEACYEKLMEVNSQLGLSEDTLLDDVSLIFSQEDSKVEVDSVTELSSGAVEQAPCKDKTDGSEIVEVLLQDLPIPDYYSSDGSGVVPAGGIVVPDPVEAILMENGGTQVRGNMTALESKRIRVFYPQVNNAQREECIFDKGSQVCSASESAAQALGITWDPNLTIGLQSSNHTTACTLGLARNVPINCGNDVIAYVQLHIVWDAAYKLLLGQPFLSVMSAQFNNTLDRRHTMTLTDPNSLNRILIPSFP
jgi:hypothetical protein